MKYFTNGTFGDLQDLKRLEGRDIVVGGIISEAKHLESRQGDYFGIFTVEDFNDSYEFRLYKEDYLKWRHLLVVNSFVHMRVAVRPGWVDKKT